MSGIASDAHRLVSLQDAHSRTAQYLQTNQIVDGRLQARALAIEEPLIGQLAEQQEAESRGRDAAGSRRHDGRDDAVAGPRGEL